MVRKKSTITRQSVRLVDSTSNDGSTPERQPGKIVSTPGICGGKPRIHGTRVPIWGLEHARQSGCSDRQIMEMFPDLVKADLAAAWAYVERHSEEIRLQIRANQE
jgi:uncharacterized protein (DUF433 family)